MKKLCAIGIAALAATSVTLLHIDAADAAKMSKAECQSLWNSANAQGSGSLSSSDAQSYVTNFAKVDTNSDGKLSSGEFLSGCQHGLVHGSASSGAGEGTSGSDRPAPYRKY